VGVTGRTRISGVIAMSENQFTPAIDADARRVALEVMATLVNLKRIAADLVLRPVGIPDDLIRRFVAERDLTTHDFLTKRQAGALILDELARQAGDRPVIRKLLDLAAGWDRFHLAQDEYKARAVAQKAREITGVLAEADARERAEQERIAEERATRQLWAFGLMRCGRLRRRGLAPV